VIVYPLLGNAWRVWVEKQEGVQLLTRQACCAASTPKGVPFEARRMVSKAFPFYAFRPDFLRLRGKDFPGFVNLESLVDPCKILWLLSNFFR
jgi:hypothetical protein